jgi:hypothetical protein
MASITSVISLFVLLAIYCNSLPVEDKFKGVTVPTTNFEFTTGKTIVDNEDKITMHLLSDDESTGVPKIHPPREYDEHEHYEFTTPAHSESHDIFSRPPRMMNDILFTTESPLTDLTHHERFTDDFLDTTTMKSSMHFEEKPVGTKNIKPKEKQTRAPTKRNMADEEVDSLPPRMMNDMLFTTESPSVYLPLHERFTDDFLDTTTMKSSMHFEEKPYGTKITEPKLKMRGIDAHRNFADKEDMETTISTEFFASTPVVEYESVTSEPSTSGDSFGKFTGLLTNDRTHEIPTKMSSGMKYQPTSESEQDDHSKEESKFEVPSKITQRLTKTVLLIPGERKETETFTDSRSKSYLMDNQSQTELTQGEKQSNI